MSLQEQLEFNGGEWFKITGRGNVYSCNTPKAFFTNEVLNKEAVIEGKTYTVTGIEASAKWRASDPIKGNHYKENEAVGLLVRGDIQ